MNLAPVVDVLSDPRSPIGNRSYGSDPALVARLSAAAVRGYQQHGLAAAAKHFIGLGHTSIDSHQALPTVTQTLAQLARVDLVPFRAAIAAGVSTVLVAHVALPAIDPVHRPASLSPVIIEGLVRKRLGFQGIVMTDSLAMGALPQGSTAQAAEQALAAGADMLLISANHTIADGVFEHAVERVVSAVRAGRLPQSRLDSAVGRILALKRHYPSAVL
jgi:beta-N-acetylhexosaminidase